MTYSIRTKDGIEITDIPDSTPKDDSRLREQVAQMRATGQTSGSFGGAAQPQPEQETPPSGIDPTLDPVAQGPAGQAVPGSGGTQDLVMSLPRVGNLPETAMNMMGGVVRGAGPIATGTLAGGAVGSIVPGVGTVAGATAGAGAMGLAQFAGDPIISGINSLFGTNYTLPTDAIEDLFTRLGVTEPKTEAEKLVQTVASGAAQAGGSVALGQALMSGVGLSPTTKGLVGQALSSGPLQQILGGAGASLGAGIAAQEGVGPVGQFASGMAGGLLGSGIGNALNLRTPAASTITKDAERAGVRLMTSDVIPPKTAASRFAQATSEKLPYFGTGGLRAEQQTQRISAVKDLLRQFGADDAARASDDVMSDMLAKRAGNLGRWTGMQQDVLESVAKAKPGQTVPMTGTLAQIDDSIAYLNSLKTANVKPAIDTLADWRNAIQDQSPENILALRRQIGEVFAAPELTNVRSTMQKQLSSIYGKVNEDLSRYIKDAGGQQDLTKWSVANKELSKLMGELDLSILKTTLEKGVDRPEVIAGMLFNKDRSVVQALNRNLTARGRASARSAIMQEVGKKIGEDVSPERFVSEIRRLKNSGDPLGVFFSGDDLQAVEGLGRVLKATQRASQAPLTPPTGVQMVIPAGAAGLTAFFGGGVEGFLGAMGTVAGAGLTARAYESAPVRNIFMQLPKVRAGSVEEAALFKRLLEAAQATQTASAAQTRTERQSTNRETDIGSTR